MLNPIVNQFHESDLNFNAAKREMHQEADVEMDKAQSSLVIEDKTLILGLFISAKLKSARSLSRMSAFSI